MKTASSQFFCRALFALVILAIPCSVSAQIRFYGVGTLPGGDYYSQMRDAIHTPDGILAVGSSTTFTEDANSSGDTPVMWTPKSGLVLLANDFPPNLSTGPMLAIARVISVDGEMIGGSTYNAPSEGWATVSPAIWTNSGETVTLLGPGSWWNCGVNCLSLDKSVAYGFIGSSAPSTSEVTEAFRYTADGGIVSIGFLHPDDNANFPATHSTSWDGRVVVGNSEGGVSPLEAYRYTFTGLGPTGGTMTALPALPGGTFTSALAMTPDGSISIGTADSPDFPNGQLVRWLERGPTESLGTPTPTDPTFGFDVLCGVSADGSVVAIDGGGAAATDNTPYIRNPSGWFNLQDILSDAGVDLTGWTLEFVSGMSVDGTLVFGSGIHNGNEEGYVAEFPLGFLCTYGDHDHPCRSHKEGPRGQQPSRHDRFSWR
jgi:uncharacterized membrane protein